MPRNTFSFTLLLMALTLLGESLAQTGFEIKLDKPKEYEERILRSERTPIKKIGLPQRMLQNTVTRYNYYFNASNKLNEVIERAKQAFTDDYTKLLPFYNYTLESTASDATQLDSIIWKTNSGIVLHDLRGDWTDDLYLLWGAAYFFQQKFDSARILFQFINQAYAPREKDGYAKTIGSARDGNNALSVSTPEKKGKIARMISKAPPRRNDAFIWQIRNYIAQNQLAEAASLIEALQRDPQFPVRLREELHEVEALLFYQQQNWDSTAHHLSQALERATNQNERARWEFLLGQLYEQTGKWSEAKKYYRRSIPRTTNPILEIYARLGAIRTDREGDASLIAENIRDLKQMAKRDKYADYRDIIYFMAAQMQGQTGDQPATKELLLNSIQVASNNASLRNQAFEQLARICLNEKEYRQAYNFYDSIQLNDPKLPNPDSIRKWKEVLSVIATQMEIIERQDSLLRIVAMPEEERKEFIRKLVKELRRQQGLKDDSNRPQPTTGTTVMGTGGTEPKGEWYFYNVNSRSRGQAEFQARWGNRPNADQWRRIAALNSSTQPTTGSGTNLPGSTGNTSTTGEIDFETLYASLPLTVEQQQKLYDSLQQAWFVLGETYTQRMEDCAKGITALELIVNTYPTFQRMDEVLFLLYFCHLKNGDEARARDVRAKLEKNFPSSPKTNLVVSGKDPAKEKQKQATLMYQTVYDQFVSGQYAKAASLKKEADSLYGKNYWTPQLAYVEAVYYIQQRVDTAAFNRLNFIVQNFQSTPLAIKAETLIRVLSRRDSIEQELKNYTSTTPNTQKADTVVKKQPTPTPPSTAKPTSQPAPVNQPTPTKPDSVSAAPKNAVYSFRPNQTHQVVVLLQDVDIVFANEAKNSIFRYNRTAFYDKQFTLEVVRLNDKQQLLLIGSFPQSTAALDYLKEVKKAAPTTIFPWLNANRYRFGIIDAENLQQVQSDKKYDDYEQYIQRVYPDLLK